MGDRKSRPDPADKRVKIEKTVQERGQPLYVVGKLPARDSASVNTGTYTCIYGFEQEVNTPGQLSEGQETYIEGYPYGGTTVQTSESEVAWIVEGTGFAGQIDTMDTRVDISDFEGVTASEFQAEQRQELTTEQQFLAQYAPENSGNAQYIQNPGELFKHHPEGDIQDSGTTAPGQVGNTDATNQVNRNPIDAFLSLIN